MSQSRRRFTPEYKDEAVKLVIDSGRPTSAVAKDLGINEGTLGSWGDCVANGVSGGFDQ